mmetsp:Transcript_157614/g.302558  ORF Transcript_157614/g.302558 Transcript_157614/m.302558 type:complete len:255 (-) Transcript_157614:145-909(-)
MLVLRAARYWCTQVLHGACHPSDRQLLFFARMELLGSESALHGLQTVLHAPACLVLYQITWPMHHAHPAAECHMELRGLSVRPRLHAAWPVLHAAALLPHAAALLQHAAGRLHAASWPPLPSAASLPVLHAAALLPRAVRLQHVASWPPLRAAASWPPLHAAPWPLLHAAASWPPLHAAAFSQPLPSWPPLHAASLPPLRAAASWPPLHAASGPPLHVSFVLVAFWPAASEPAPPAATGTALNYSSVLRSRCRL